MESARTATQSKLRRQTPLQHPCKALLIDTPQKTEIISDLCCRLTSRNPQSLSLPCERSVCLQASNCRAALHVVHGVGAILGGQEGSCSVLLTIERCSTRVSVINTFFFIFYFYIHSLENPQQIQRLNKQLLISYALPWGD